MNRQHPHPVTLNALSRASVLDTLAVLRDVVLPTLGKGPLVRRRRVVGMAERAGMSEKAVQRMQALRSGYGPGPLLLRVPFRKQAVILSAEDARAVLGRLRLSLDQDDRVTPGRLPGTLDNHTLSFSASRADA